MMILLKRLSRRMSWRRADIYYFTKNEVQKLSLEDIGASECLKFKKL